MQNFLSILELQTYNKGKQVSVDLPKLEELRSFHSAFRWTHANILIKNVVLEKFK